MLDIIITSSSRPQLFPYFWESFKKMVHIRCPKRVIVHEDFVLKDESKEAIKYIYGLKQKGEIQEYHSDNPPVGLGYSISGLLDKVNTKYVVYLQEDWEFERPVDIDQLIWVMDNNIQVNSIFLNKSKNFKTLNGALQKQYTYSGVEMCLYHQWTFLPGIWRMDHVRKYWRCSSIRPEGHFTNAFGTHEQRMDCDYCERVLGVYMLGKSEDYRFVRHIGNDWRMEKWRLENGKPGGVHDTNRMDKPYVAPWVLLPDRPVRKPNPNEIEIQKWLQEEPPEAQNAKVEN